MEVFDFETDLVKALMRSIINLTETEGYDEIQKHDFWENLDKNIEKDEDYMFEFSESLSKVVKTVLEYTVVAETTISGKKLLAVLTEDGMLSSVCEETW